MTRLGAVSAKGPRRALTNRPESAIFIPQRSAMRFRQVYSRGGELRGAELNAAFFVHELSIR